jgi:hypothetical protein
MCNIALGGTAAPSLEAGLPSSPKPSVHHMAHIIYDFIATLTRRVLDLHYCRNSHSGSIVSRTFSFFFIVLTALDMAGQKCPEKEIFSREKMTFQI